MTGETLRAVSPLAGWELDPGTDDLFIAEVPLLRQVNVRTDPRGPAAAALAAEFGAALPSEPCTFVHAGDVRILWLGPDEWLLVGPADSDVEPRARAAAATGVAAVTDVSAQRTSVTVRGPRARDVLAHGCAIDLHPSVSPAGTCVQTLLAGLGVILLVDAPGDHTVFVRTSFAEHLGRWLLDVTAS